MIVLDSCDARKKLHCDMLTIWNVFVSSFLSTEEIISGKFCNLNQILPTEKLNAAKESELRNEKRYVR